MRVDLRRGEAGVAEQVLDDPEVSAAIEEVRGERVPEQVGVHSLDDACSDAASGQPPLDGARPQPPAGGVQEESLRPTRSEQHGTALFEVGAQRRSRRYAEAGA